MALVALFGVMICAAVVLSAALANRISVVQDVKAGDFSDILNRANDADDFVDGASAFYSLTQLAIVVLFIIWQFRAAKNNEALDRPGARFGPGWSIGAWFIPLANLAIPVLIMQDLWRGATPSVPRGDPRWRSAKGSWLIGVWWAVWVISLLRFAANNSGLHGTGSLDDIETSNIIALVGVIATAIAAVLAACRGVDASRRQLDTLRAQRATYEVRLQGQARQVAAKRPQGQTRQGAGGARPPARPRRSWRRRSRDRRSRRRARSGGRARRGVRGRRSAAPS